MARRRGSLPRLALLLSALLAAGCVQSPDSPDATSYLLLDRAARAHFTVERDGWEGAPVLPVALDTEEPALLRGPEGVQLLDLRGGMLAHVRGADGEIEWLALGEEARDDRLALHASEAGAAALAELIAGEATPRGDGLWTLEAPDVLERGSFLEVPEGVLEALPDTRPDLGDLAELPPSAGVARGALLAPAAVVPAEDGPRGAAEPGQAEAELVGLYVAELRTLLLDASGGFTFEDRCSGQVLATGRYFAVDDRVVLKSTEQAPIVLGLDRGRLIHPGGAEFALLEPEPPKASQTSVFGKAAW